MNARATGKEKEQLAAAYLEARGMQIVERNFRGRQGEVDLIGRHGGCLVFVEVKYRAGLARGSALEAVTFHKQRQVCKTADYYRMLRHLGDDTAVRYDVVAIQGEEILWIQNAFPHIYTRG